MSSLADRINEGLKQAMKAQDETRKRTIRAVKAQILLLKTDGSGEEVTDEKILKALQKMVKQREESLGIYEAQNREDLAQKEREEIAVLREFLPSLLSASELEAAVAEIIAQTGAASMKDLGNVMKQANQQLAGRAEGKAISEVAKKLLQG